MASAAGAGAPRRTRPSPSPASWGRSPMPITGRDGNDTTDRWAGSRPSPGWPATSGPRRPQDSGPHRAEGPIRRQPAAAMAFFCQEDSDVGVAPACATRSLSSSAVIRARPGTSADQVFDPADHRPGQVGALLAEQRGDGAFDLKRLLDDRHRAGRQVPHAAQRRLDGLAAEQVDSDAAHGRGRSKMKAAGCGRRGRSRRSPGTGRPSPR